MKNLLNKRLLFNFLILSLIRIGTYLPIPTFNAEDLTIYIESHIKPTSTFSSLFSSGNEIIGLFYLSIFPYITSSILVQILCSSIPKLKKMQEEGDIQSRRSITKLTRIITLIISIEQSLASLSKFDERLFNFNYLLSFQTLICLTTGSMIILWFSELINDYGIGNGSAVIILTNILANMPSIGSRVIGELKQLSISPIPIILSIVIITSSIVFIQKCKKLILLVSVKQLTTDFKNNNIDLFPGNYLPLQYAQSGVLPIILATCIILVLQNSLNINLEYGSAVYWVIYFLLILSSSFNYANLLFNPVDIAKKLEKMSVSVLKIRPGRRTIFFFKQSQIRIILLGASSLGLLVLIPSFIILQFNIKEFNGIGVTSVIISAGILLDLLNENKNVYLTNLMFKNYSKIR